MSARNIILQNVARGNETKLQLNENKRVILLRLGKLSPPLSFSLSLSSICEQYITRGLVTGTAVESLGISESFEAEDDRKNPKENEIEAVDYSNGSVYIVSKLSIRKIVGKIVLPLYSSNPRAAPRSFVRSRPSSTFRVPSSAKPFICRGKRQTPPATEESSVMGSIDLPFHEGSAGRRLRAHLPLIFARTNRFRVNEACKQTSSTFDRPKFFHFE